MNRSSLLAAFVCASALAACGPPPAAKGTIPPGTPPPDYEQPRGYDPGAAPAPTAAPADPAAPPIDAPAQPTAAPATPTAAPTATAPSPTSTPAKTP